MIYYIYYTILNIKNTSFSAAMVRCKKKKPCLCRCFHDFRWFHMDLRNLLEVGYPLAMIHHRIGMNSSRVNDVFHGLCGLWFFMKLLTIGLNMIKPSFKPNIMGMMFGLPSAND